jgi:hypothetical protein
MVYMLEEGSSKQAQSIFHYHLSSIADFGIPFDDVVAVGHRNKVRAE